MDIFEINKIFSAHPIHEHGASLDIGFEMGYITLRLYVFDKNFRYSERFDILNLRQVESGFERVLQRFLDSAMVGLKIRRLNHET